MLAIMIFSFGCKGISSDWTDSSDNGTGEAEYQCSVENGGCDPLTSCSDEGGVVVCGNCPTGYSGTGNEGCVDINECSVSNGGCEQNCTNLDGNFSCSCFSGYTLNIDGFNCDGGDPCQSGGPLNEVYDPCVAAVCTVDPWCCNTEWDETCQEKVYFYCNASCNGSGSGCTQCGTCSGTDPMSPASTCGASHHCKPQAGSDSPGLCIEGVGTGGYFDACTSSEDCVADTTCINIGAATWSVCLQWCRVGGSDCSGGEICTSYSTARYIGTQEWGICSGTPASWTCNASYFGDGECDCGCGAFDPDCVDATVGSCDYCDLGCGTGTCPSNIITNENWGCF
ncbi:calcium-binding EGF-like domain-containing protein [Spirochaetota bacterium]